MKRVLFFGLIAIAIVTVVVGLLQPMTHGTAVAKTDKTMAKQPNAGHAGIGTTRQEAVSAREDQRPEAKPATETRAQAASLLPVTSGERTTEGFDIVKWPEGTPRYEGEWVTSDVVMQDGRKLRLTVNQAGEFPRMQVQAGETAQIKMQFQTSPGGMPVALTAQDGGGFEKGKVSQSVQLADDRSVSFAFTAGQNDGVHRVSVTTPGGEVKNFDFWVGPLNIMRATAQR